jgi:hypothetical protein
MLRARNIAKIMILTAVILLFGMNRYASAQNTPDGPYLNSWHQYSVTKGVAAHTATWHLELASNRSTTVPLNNGLWVDINLIVGIEYISIYFTELEGFTITAPNNHWFLVYSEWDNLAPGVCTARREFEINITENSFYLSLPATGSVCNSRTEDVWDNSVEFLNNPGRSSTVEFTVTMNKVAEFLIDRWRFRGTISFPSGSTVLDPLNPFATTPSGTSVSGGNWTITNNGGNFDLEVIYSGGDFGGETDEVTFRVDVLGDITADFEILLELTNGQADSGDPSIYIVKTDDNLSKGGGREGLYEIFGVPNTSVVTVNP